MTTGKRVPGPGHGLDAAELSALIATDSTPGAARTSDTDADPDAGPDAGPGEAAEETAAALNKGALFARVKARADGVQGRQIRVVIDAVLDELGAALVAGETLKLPPLGTLKVQRHWEAADADLLICKLRRKKPEGDAKDPLAEPAEES